VSKANDAVILFFSSILLLFAIPIFTSHLPPAGYFFHWQKVTKNLAKTIRHVGFCIGIA